MITSRHLIRSLAVVAALTLASFAYVGMFVHRVTREELSAEIAEAIPVGTQESDVVAWLKSKGDVRIYGRFPTKSSVDANATELGAIVDDTGPRRDDPHCIVMRFVFSGDRLSRVELQKRHTPFVFGT